MKLTTKLLGILIASIALVACGGGGSDPVVKTEKVWKLMKQVDISNGVTTEDIDFKYDGNGRLIKKILKFQDVDDNEYNKYTYDDEGFLLRDILFATSTNKPILGWVYGHYGEVVSKLFPKVVNGSESLVEVYHYNNIQYTDDLTNDIEMQKEIKKYTQRKILQGRHEQSEFPYLGGKLVLRERKVDETVFITQEITYDDRAVTIRHIYPPSTGEPDWVIIREYDDYGNPAYKNHDYVYYPDANGNLEKSVRTSSSFGVVTRHYTWEPMDIPVQ